MLIPCGARRAVEGHGSLPEPDPGEHAAHEPVALGHGEEAIERLAVDQAEVAGVAGNRRFGERAGEAIEEVGGHKLEAAFAAARRALGANDVIALLPSGDQRMDDFGRILQIGVHDDDRAAGGVVEPGGDRDLMAEIAR